MKRQTGLISMLFLLACKERQVSKVRTADLVSPALAELSACELRPLEDSTPGLRQFEGHIADSETLERASQFLLNSEYSELFTHLAGAKSTRLPPKNITSKMDPIEAAAIVIYIDGGFKKMNAALRNNATYYQQWKDVISITNSGLNKLKMPYKGTVYRQEQISKVLHEQLYERFKEGSIIGEYGFTSCSASQFAVQHFAAPGKYEIVYTIISKNGVDIRAFNTADQEVIFRPGTIFKVKSLARDRPNSKITRVFLEEVDQS